MSDLLLADNRNELLIIDNRQEIRLATRLSDILTWGNISGKPSLFPPEAHNHNDIYYTKTQLNTSGSGGQVHWDNVTSKPIAFPPDSHNHNDLYYTKTQLNTSGSGGQVHWDNVSNKPTAFPPDQHDHNDIYYTKTQLNTSGSGGQVHWDNVSNKPTTFPPNAHNHTPNEVGLGNVTNDAQLKRSGNDFATFTEKTAPTDNDLTLIEDSQASNVKKKITFGNIYLWIKSRLDNLYAALSHQHDASAITSGTLSTNRFSAYDDLIAENRIGAFSGSVFTITSYRWFPTVQDWTSTTLPGGWAWAGSPFVTPPIVEVSLGTVLTATGYTSASRSFLYRNFPPEKRDFVAELFLTAISTAYVGIRIDDGTDNNYIEVVIRNDSSTASRSVVSRWRIGGGTPTEQSASNLSGNWIMGFGNSIFVFLNVFSPWTSWSFAPVLHTQHGHVWGSPSISQNFSWTPVRAGIIIQSSSISWERYGVDYTNF